MEIKKKNLPSDFKKCTGSLHFTLLLAASDLFDMFTQLIKFYTFHYHVIKGTHAWTKIHQRGSKNEWLLFLAGFTEKFALVFVLTL